jgi:hypothetical protein
VPKADWSRHRENARCPHGSHGDVANVRFAEFYEKFKGNFEDNLFVEGMSMVQFTVMRTESLCGPPDARNIVMAHAQACRSKPKQTTSPPVREVDKG